MEIKSSKSKKVKFPTSSQSYQFSSNLPAPINVSSTEQTKTGNLIIGGNLTTAGFKMTTGAGADKVLTTDASGVASWQTPAGGSLWTQTGNDIYYRRQRRHREDGTT